MAGDVRGFRGVNAGLSGSALDIKRSEEDFMSQRKVDLYKEEKKNRKQIMKKEKFRTRIAVVVTVVVFAALIGWFSWAVYNNQKENAEAEAGNQTTTLDLTMMESYQTQLANYEDTLKKENESGTGADSSESVASSSDSAASGSDTVVSSSSN